MQPYNDSKKICQLNNSTLVSIHYAEEQNFLTNYIFTKKKVIENVWIGARYVGNKLFYWEDHTQLTGAYSNWGAGFPKNLNDHCVELHAEEGSVGKWFEERCGKKNMVVCQKVPETSLKLLAETVLELKHSLLQTVSRLTETENELIKTKKVMTQNSNALVETKKEVEQLKKESIPIGFVYVQLPKNKAPAELWPTLTWKDISAEYEGVFFRVVGGGAANFGTIQDWNAPRLEMVHMDNQGNKIGKAHGEGINLTIPASGWSEGIYTGSSDGRISIYVNFKLSNIAEVRPKNMAIKVYRRTA